jgi:centromere-localized protein 2
MAPHTTETGILQSYLLPPASLTNILSFSQFQQLFPASSRSHPHVKTLYRDLQFLRSVDADVVRENIDSETRNSNALTRDILRDLQAERKQISSQPRKRKRNDEGPSDGARTEADVAIDTQLFGALGMLPKHDRYHDTDSLLAEMETACEALEREGEASQQEADVVLAAMQETVGNLSDLRYGKFAKMAGSEAGDGLEKSVVESLKALDHAFARPTR